MQVAMAAMTGVRRSMAVAIAVVVAAFVLPSGVVVGAAVENTCTPNGGVYTVQTKSDASQFPVDCTRIIGNVLVQCTPDAQTTDGGLSSLSFLGTVETIEGYLRIQDCDKLVSLGELANLRVIEGTPDQGLTIQNNDLLESLAGLEGLTAITNGGVDIWHNDLLCYADLFKFERIVDGATSADSPLIRYALKPATCATLLCDSDCSCGYCAGPGECIASCDDNNIAWVAAPVILGVLLLVALIFLCRYLKKRDLIECDCFVTTKKSLKSSHVHPSQKPKQQYKGSPSMPATNTTFSAPFGSQYGADGAMQQPLLHQQPQQQPQEQPRYQCMSPQQLQQPEHALAPEPAAPEPMDDNVRAVCVCGKDGEFDCSRCNKQTYCSSECQRAHWKEHREACKAAAREKLKAKQQQAGDNLAQGDGFGNCVMCAKPAEFECSRCRGPAYCSASCQRSHWREHGPECKKKSAGRAAPPATSPQAPTVPGTVVEESPDKLPTVQEEAAAASQAAAPAAEPQQTDA
eukprot:m.42647 g.42647  ORF g.42647 m.42647 type:complete len:517 (-) comp11562_c0_seq1:351-1901(-)